ncbi:hypothetical protein ALC53_03825 [Atta colombica]|uniref:Uncharacterized protein n=1 Tax=Atta colombica TaxID=520822 RepID=A0A195BMX3_9HYME|nr:hypothetical protein ALC53_03825 [Atta colombica]
MTSGGLRLRSSWQLKIGLSDRPAVAGYARVYTSPGHTPVYRSLLVRPSCDASCGHSDDGHPNGSCPGGSLVMHKDKEENSHHDSHYRARELAALAAYDHHHLDGEMFLQHGARTLIFIAVKDTCFLFALDRSSQSANHSGEIYHHERDLVRDACLRNK